MSLKAEPTCADHDNVSIKADIIEIDFVRLHGIHNDLY